MYAVVTGGSRGIGAAVVKQLAQDGYDIVINYRGNHTAAEETAAVVREHGREVELLACDVSDRIAVKEALTALVERRGAPDVLVVNAGITKDGLLALMGDEEWDDVLAIGLGGFYNIVRPLIGPMLQRRTGRIVTMSSVTGLMGNPGQVNYAAAKGGLIAATKSLAKEIAKRTLTANVVAPGLIDTDMTRDLPLDHLKAAIPMGRLGTVEEVASAVSWLCSPGAAYVTGQVLNVGGGIYM